MGELLNKSINTFVTVKIFLFVFLRKSNLKHNQNENRHLCLSKTEIWHKLCLQACFQLLQDVASTVPSNDFSSEMVAVSLVGKFSQQLFQCVSPSRHRNIVSSEARSRAEVVPAIPHVKYLLILRTSITALWQVQLQDFPLTQVHGALLAVVRMVVSHLHAALLVDASWVGENVINRCTSFSCLQDPLDKHGVGVGDDYAVNSAFMFQNKC